MALLRDEGAVGEGPRLAEGGEGFEEVFGAAGAGAFEGGGDGGTPPADRTGLGLGLAISKSSVEANRGTLSVHDLPGTGCVFTIDLPLHRLPGRALAEAGAGES